MSDAPPLTTTSNDTVATDAEPRHDPDGAWLLGFAARLDALTGALAAAETPEEVARAAIDFAVAAIGARSGRIFLAADDGTTLRAVAACNVPEALAGCWQAMDEATRAPTAEAFRTGRPVTVPSRAELAARYPDVRDYFERLGSEAVYSAPLRAGTRRLGTLTCTWDEPRAFGPLEEAFFAAVAGQCALALDRAQAWAAEHAARARTAQLHALAASLADAVTPSAVAAAAVSHVAAIFGGAGTIVTLLAPEGDALDIVDVDALDGGTRAEWARIPLAADAPLADAARARAPIFLESRAAWASRYPHLLPVLDATGHQANAVVPMLAGDLLLGVLGVAFASARAFDEDDRAVAVTVARQVAQALRRAQLYESERAAREEAQRASRAKSEFLAVMSHELRTPLNAIGGYVDLLAMGVHGPVTAGQHETLERVRAASARLLALVGDVLDVSRIESGRVSFDVHVVDLGEVVHSVLPFVEPQFRASGITLDVRLPGGGDAEAPAARADAAKLGQVLLNLLGNACKFTPAGGRVVVEVAHRADDTDPADLVFLRVSDTGRGIPDDMLEAVFEPYRQLDQSSPRTQHGAGLGLAISRDLIHGMGGTLRARSADGAGAAFTIALPRADRPAR